jgi:hypothetical protein
MTMVSDCNGASPIHSKHNRKSQILKVVVIGEGVWRKHLTGRDYDTWLYNMGTPYRRPPCHFPAPSPS